MAAAVRLKLARREFFSGGGFSGTFMPVSVKVKNIALAKDVTVLYTPDGGTWKEAPLTFASHFGDYDIFSDEVNEQVLRFAIRYSVVGSTFFDNNAGLDYSFGSNFATVGGNVVLSTATSKRGSQAGGGFVFTTSWLEGQILVNNLAFAKDVGVRLSADGGLTWHDTHGSFAGAHHRGRHVRRIRRGGLAVQDAGAQPEHFRIRVPVRRVLSSPVDRRGVLGQQLRTGLQSQHVPRRDDSSSAPAASIAVERVMRRDPRLGDHDARCATRADSQPAAGFAGT